MAAIDTFLDRVRTTRMLVVGDVMVDAYLWGRVDRISPEAPVPVVQVTERSARLGGAANVAINAHVLGARPVVVSVIGQDANADLMERLSLRTRACPPPVYCVPPSAGPP
jgi:bifunctional ADP-heptose synthase (sugar kinase/adenylyltransferase)